MAFRLVRVVGRLATVTLAGLCLLGGLGQVARDRSVFLALCLYVPLGPVGLVAAGYDLARRGRSLGKARFGLALLGLIAVVGAGVTMVGFGPRSPSGPPGDEVKILHWNVLWGGGRGASEGSWAGMSAEINRRSPDVVVLSEAPPDRLLARLVGRLGPRWRSAQVEHAPGSRDWYKLVVLSRWQVGLEGRPTIRDGAAMVVRVDRPGRPIRLLVVDGRSEITHSRTPMLRDIAATCERAGREGRPIDVVAGDFNAVGRGVGFDALAEAAGGYRLASRSHLGWRGTFPAPCPVYDIDHVWVAAGSAIVSCEIFAHAASDHRGQLVRVGLDAGGPR